ncbi:30S ribosomal protein S9 [Candidatus Kaiserbacteria bacterium CG10_big_fil_rev_8_21_14_0_10_43_70]|uniref:30S ribosomal protein S9 n=1 Tax=Candidatus Kaiserbacteria bacterium CG10_big_fil_rev_8_21_14_0_10_43_70 TaxID=1974605 RepID=A0A2H0UIL7_9BACT|nr:MAG: 30S ribosomal protein S9 [Candidatus Kaiserbacteria bacterium CG10_big_fil_rev_8_21_14_0_10_43_70]
MASKDKYIEAVGRRKTATARVRITPSGQEKVIVNEKALADYFTLLNVQGVVMEALKNAGEKFSVTAKVSGGGLKAQAEAIRHGIARAIVKKEEGMRKEMKGLGFLKRDPRMKERKKFGLRGARRAPQWSKR